MQEISFPFIKVLASKYHPRTRNLPRRAQRTLQSRSLYKSNKDHFRHWIFMDKKEEKPIKKFAQTLNLKREEWFIKESRVIDRDEASNRNLSKPKPSNGDEISTFQHIKESTKISKSH